MKVKPNLNLKSANKVIHVQKGNSSDTAMSEADCILEMDRREAVFRTFGFDSAAGIDYTLSKILPLSGSILEVGSGKGRFLTALAKQTSSSIITSIDIDPAEQRYARMNVNHFGLNSRVHFLTLDAEDMGWPAGIFDAVVTMNAMHHIPNPDRALAEMVRVLKPGGKLAICDFSPSGFYLMDRMQQAEGKTHPHPQRSFPWWQAWLRNLGFRTRSWSAYHEEILVAEA